MLVDKIQSLNVSENTKLTVVSSLDGTIAMGQMVYLTTQDGSNAPGPYINDGIGWTGVNFGGAVAVQKWVEYKVQKITSPNPETSGIFGLTVSVSDDGTVVAIAAGGEDIVSNNSGACYVYRLVNGQYEYSQRLLPTPNNLAAGSQFGRFVTMSGDGATIVSTAPYAETDQKGHVYIFRDTNGTFSQVSDFVESTSETNVRLGNGANISTSYDGTIVAAGATLDVSGSSDAGSVIIYRFNGTVYTRDQQIDNPEPQLSSSFVACALSDDGSTLAIGAILHTHDGISGAGACWLFEDQNGTFVQVAKLTADDASTNNAFGFSPRLSGDGSVVTICAWVASTLKPTSLYIFKKNGSVWNQIQKFSYGNETSDQYGLRGSITADGSFISVGEKNIGVMFVYEYNSSSGLYEQIASINTNSPDTTSQFGVSSSLSTNGLVLAVGAHAEDSAGADAGAAFIYTTQDTEIIAYGMKEVSENATLVSGSAVLGNGLLGAMVSPPNVNGRLLHSTAPNNSYIEQILDAGEGNRFIVGNMIVDNNFNTPGTNEGTNPFSVYVSGSNSNYTKIGEMTTIYNGSTTADEPFSIHMNGTGRYLKVYCTGGGTSAMRLFFSRTIDNPWNIAIVPQSYVTIETVDSPTNSYRYVGYSPGYAHVGGTQLGDVNNFNACAGHTITTFYTHDGGDGIGGATPAFQLNLGSPNLPRDTFTYLEIEGIGRLDPNTANHLTAGSDTIWGWNISEAQAAAFAGTDGTQRYFNFIV